MPFIKATELFNEKSDELGISKVYNFYEGGNYLFDGGDTSEQGKSMSEWFLILC